jgi:orotidine-5'-phosphate decarboxylase
MVPDMPILIPGIGAQGGDLRSAVRYGCDRHGELAVVNASRSVIFASPGDDFADASRSAALNLRDEINRYREHFF